MEISHELAEKIQSLLKKSESSGYDYLELALKAAHYDVGGSEFLHDFIQMILHYTFAATKDMEPSEIEIFRGHLYTIDVLEVLLSTQTLHSIVN